LKKKTLIILLAVIGVVIATSLGIYAFLKPKEPIKMDKKAKKKTQATVVTPPAYFCSVCGEETSKENSELRPIAVIVENHPAARPQSGLEDACTIYEVVAEGGITRFLAIYTHSECKNIGPVRSVREYFAEIAKGYDALLAHCGGSPTGYSMVKSLNIADLDEFANSGAYWRAKDRKMPHNLYTSTENLRKRAAERKFDTDSSFEPFKFKKDAPVEDRPEETYVEIDFSSPKFKVRYEYNKEKNSYLRFMSGLAHKDRNSGNQLEVKNILVQKTSISVVDKIGRVRIGNVGSGEGYAFLDGKVFKGKWVRDSLSKIIKFYDESGNELQLNRGQTWVEVISPDRKVNFPETTS